MQTEPPPQASDEISLLVIAAALLRNRWKLAAWLVIGGIVAFALVARRPKLYEASATFMPQGSDQTRAGLAAIAGQLGVSVGPSSQAVSPDFYVQLLKSRVLLGQLARDTFTVNELAGRRVPLVDLLEIPPGAAPARLEQATVKLNSLVGASVERVTGVVQVTAKTEWPSVSLAIVQDLVNGVDEFNQHTRQSQAAAERKFLESQLEGAARDLRASEAQLEEFARNNRLFLGSPELTVQHDRLVRDVTLKQSVFTTLTQAYEDARLREVRDTPVITVIEPPAVPTRPAPRGRLKIAVFGMILGGIFGMFLALRRVVTGRANQADPETREFSNAWQDAKTDMLAPLRWVARRKA